MPSLPKVKRQRTRSRLLSTSAPARRVREASGIEDLRRLHTARESDVGSEEELFSEASEAAEFDSACGSEDSSDLELPRASRRPGNVTRSRFQSHTDRRKNEEESYRLLRDEGTQIATSAAYHAGLRSQAATQQSNAQHTLQQAARRCSCPQCRTSVTDCEEISSVRVLVIGLFSHYHAAIPLFRCLRCEALFHSAPQLAGAFPGTPVLAVDLTQQGLQRDRVCFELSLLEFLRLLRVHNPRVALDSFTATLADYQSQAGDISWKGETVRRQLRKTLEEYENVLFRVEEQVTAALSEGDRTLLSCCPACPQAADSPDNSGDASCPANEGPHIYLDGNFRLPHRATAGTATRHLPPIQHRLIPDEVVKDFCGGNDMGSSVPAPGVEEACHNFNADKQLGRRKAKYDVTGVFGAFCRHGMVICALNMVTGEKWSYATLILKILLEQGIIPSFVWYDINCRYGKHFLRWLEGSQLPRQTVERASRAQFPLPVFHHSMHDAACQSQNSFRRMDGAGRGAGEPPEAAWSHIGPYGYVTQNASLPARHAELERIVLYWNQAKERRLPGLLGAMHSRAIHGLAEAKTKVEDLRAHAAMFGITDFQIAEALRADVAPTLPLEELPWEAQYVRLLLEQSLVYGSGPCNGVSADLISASAAGRARLGSVTRAVKLQRELEEIELTHHIQQPWQPDTEEYTSGFRQFASHMVASRRREVMRLVQELLLVEGLFKRTQQRRGDGKRLLRVKERQRLKIKAAAQLWWEWTQVGPGARSGNAIPELQLREIIDGHYPWQETYDDGLLEIWRPRFALQLDTIKKAEEELKLVMSEATRARDRSWQQITAAKQVLQEASAEPSTSRAAAPEGLQDLISARMRRLLQLHADLDTLVGRLCGAPGLGATPTADDDGDGAWEEEAPLGSEDGSLADPTEAVDPYLS